ncbi:MAG: hypothetical protein AB7K24_33560 [Gemmataceae bacterium]
MSLFDWVDVGMSESTSEAFHSVWTGSFDCTLGNAVYSVFGAEYDTFFGPYVMLVVDLEDMLFSKLEEFLPAVSSLMSGIGGQVCYTYGSAIAATYFGPQVTIQRCPSVEKTSENILPHFTAAGPATAAGVGPNDPIDVATALAVGALSLLGTATVAAMDLAIHFKYPTYGDDEGGYQKTPELLASLSYTIESRCLALIKTLEVKGGWAGMAEQMHKEAKMIGLAAAVFALACIPLFGWYGLALWAVDYDLKGALTDAKNALTED